MVTDYPYPLAPRDEVLTTSISVGSQGLGLGSRVLDWLRQLVCGFHGHDALLQFEQDRMYLRCASCGHESPGWTLDEAPPTVTFRGDARRHAIVRPQLLDARQIA